MEQTDNYNAFFMEWIPHGVTMTEYLDRHRRELSEEEIKNFALQLLQAQLQLRRAGVYHRDVKCDNTIVSPSDLRLYVIDFGLSEDWKQTYYTEFAGTPSYMGPEMFRYPRFYYSGPSTVFSLGVIMYKMSQVFSNILCHDQF